MWAVEAKALGKAFLAKRKAPGLRGSLQSLWRPQFDQIEAVRGISFAVETGETVAFIGPNGAGKSTTIKMLTGILYPTSGEARVLGAVPWQDRQQLAFQIGTVFGQKSQLWYHLPAADTFSLLARIYELDDAAFRRRRDELVERFELQGFLHTPVRKLSLGQRMRAEIAASLLHRPRVLFLDEPTIGLDVLAKAAIRDLIRAASREEGVTIFLTSHDAGDIEQVCRRAIIIDHGRIIFDDKVSTLRRRYLRKKVVELRVADAVTDFAMEAVQVVKASGHGLKLEIDTDRQPVEAVLARLLAEHQVLDITIADPSMEDIITQVYGAGGVADDRTG